MGSYDLETVGNVFEAGLWLLVSGIFLIKAIQARNLFRRTFLILAGGFFVFGISDFIESQTGAWWRPPWLLLIKVLCITVFVYGFGNYYQLTRRKTRGLLKEP